MLIRRPLIATALSVAAIVVLAACAEKAPVPATESDPTPNRELVLYLATMQRAVTRHWVRPAGFGDDDASVVLFLRVDADGRVSEVRIQRSNGRPEIDKAALAALQAATPFDPPPASAVERLRREGIVLKFAPPTR